MDMTTIGARLKAVREERNVTVAELSEALGINKATLYRYESAEFQSIKPAILQRIAEYLKVNPDYLIGVSDNKHTVQEAEAFMADITDAEKTVLELFRKLTADDQSMALDVLRAVLKRGQ